MNAKRTNEVGFEDIEAALLHSEAASEGHICDGNRGHSAHEPNSGDLAYAMAGKPVPGFMAPPRMHPDDVARSAVERDTTRITNELEALILESETLQAKLLATVGRPSSHIHSRIKALKDALEIVTGTPIPRTDFNDLETGLGSQMLDKDEGE